jgi:hypothetical protein
MRKKTPFALVALAVGIVGGSAAASPIVTSIAQERSVSIAVQDFITSDDQTLVSDSSSKLGAFDCTPEASYSVGEPR